MPKTEKAVGTWFVLAAFVFWGLLPIYWKALAAIPPLEILAHRIFWAFIFAVFLLWIQRRWREFKETFRIPKNRALFVLTAAIVGSNWFIYIWAVNHDHIVDTSLGYFINPLIAVLLGVIFLRERLNFWQIVAFFLALLGVSYLTFQYGKIPWIALSLAFTFGFYSLFRKTDSSRGFGRLNGRDRTVVSPDADLPPGFGIQRSRSSGKCLDLPSSLVAGCRSCNRNASFVVYFGRAQNSLVPGRIFAICGSQPAACF